MDHKCKGENGTVIGELATRMSSLNSRGNKHRRDGASISDDDDLPSPPPILQAYSGPSVCQDEDLPAPPPKSTHYSPNRKSSPPKQQKNGGAGRGRAKSGNLPKLNMSKVKCQTTPPTPFASGSGSATPTKSNPSTPKTPIGRQLSRAETPKKTTRSPLNRTNSVPAQSVKADINDPEILAKIGNRAVKTNKPTKSCHSCRKGLAEGEDGCLAFGKVFHKDCFKCKKCRKKLEEKFFSKGDEPYCVKCYKSCQEQCCACKENISGDCVVSSNKYYHPNCITCQVCGEHLRGPHYFTFMNNPICEAHYKEHQEVCSVCKEVIDETYYTLDGKIYCEKDYMNVVDHCAKCDKEIKGHMIRITGAAYHTDCFRCETCQKKLDGIPFISDDNKKIYCPDDYTKKFAAVCNVCKKVIVPKEGQTTAPRIRALGKDYHPPCFKCEDCGMVLDSRIKGKECYPIKSHVLCVKCNRRRQSESEESDSE